MKKYYNQSNEVNIRFSYKITFYYEIKVIS